MTNAVQKNTYLYLKQTIPSEQDQTLLRTNIVPDLPMIVAMTSSYWSNYSQTVFFHVFPGIPSGETTPNTPTPTPNEGFSPGSTGGNAPAVIYPWMRRMQAPGMYNQHF